MQIQDTESLEKEKVFKIIKDYLKKQSISMIQEVIPYVENRLKNDDNFNRNKIEMIIKQLIREKQILLGTQLTRDDILKTKTRAIIYKYIKENPGVNFNDIMNNNHLGTNQTIWHTKFLAKYDYICIRRYGKQKVFFCNEIGERYHDLLFYLNHDKIKNLISFFQKNYEIFTATAISKSTNMHYKTVRKYLEIMLKLKLLTIGEKNNNKVYEFNWERFDEIQTTIEEIIPQTTR